MIINILKNYGDEFNSMYNKTFELAKLKSRVLMKTCNDYYFTTYHTGF